METIILFVACTCGCVCEREKERVCGRERVGESERESDTGSCYSLPAGAGTGADGSKRDEVLLAEAERSR